MDGNTIRNIIAVVIIAGAGLIPALVVYNMVRPMKKSGRTPGAGSMDMNVRGVKLPDAGDNDSNDLGSSAGRW